MTNDRNSPEIDQARLKELLIYNEHTGQFIRRVTSYNQLAGTIAGSIRNGYIRIQIYKKRYQAHRLAFLYMTGRWPDNQVDHRDMNPANNRWSNLREASTSQNSMNKKKMSCSSQPYKGIRRQGRRFAAEIKVEGKRIYLGTFATEIEASECYQRAATEHFGEFAR